MPGDTPISWCESSWNPHHGCFKVSEGCRNCNAERTSFHRYGHTDEEWTVTNAEANITLQEHHLEWPSTLDDPQRIFVNSMSDLFLPPEFVPDDHLHRIFDEIEANPEHVFIALTKHGTETGGRHPDEARIIQWDREYGRWPDNLWMGVSIGTNDRAYRAECLRRTGAATKWISFEPLVGPINDPAGTLAGIDWALVGGESGGDDRREMDHAWARDIRDAAEDLGIPFYFKQSSGPKQGHEPELAEAGADRREAAWQGAGTTLYRDLPELTDELREHRPDLAEWEVREDAE